MWLALGEYRGPARADAFVAYTVERAKAKRERDAYRSYIADSLHLRGKGMFIGQRLSELMHPKPTCDPDEVLDSIVEGAGLEVIE